MLSRRFLLSLTCLFFTLTSSAARSSVEWDLVQPAESRHGLILESRPGQARVELRGERRSYPLRPTERLTAIVELDDGWAAAGKRTEGGQSRLIVFTDDSQGFRRLEAPAADGAELQLAPQLLVRGGRLSGIAWLEGDSPRELTVRARDWSGVDWGPTAVVGPRQRGSQTGLAAATLASGEEILVWSAFDGNDDEILFSVNRGGSWSAPSRLAAGNRVPDVAPAIVAVRGGALAAWSRFDGLEYELVIARYRRGSWRKPRVVAGGGALFAGFVRLDGKLHLVYRTAAPRGWGVVEIGINGIAQRRASFLETNPGRPAIELDGPMAIQLRLPDRSVDRGYWDLP